MPANLKRQYDCNPSKCDDLNCYDAGFRTQCRKCKWIKPDCEFDQETDDRICDDCRQKEVS